MDRRRDLRARVDRFRRFTDEAACDPAVALDAYYEQGYDLMSSTQAQLAFNLANEPDPVRDAYGRNSFGQRALLARRLVEAGVPFITLNQGGWDHHIGIFKAYKQRMAAFESTIAELIQDLDRRGLLETTLVVALGEFGRTPKINKDGGARPLVQRDVGPLRRLWDARRPGRRLDRPARLRRQ